jgi:hypothetical protein
MKLLFENWRKFINEEKDIMGALDSELDQEGGAAGLDPLVGAAKKVDADATEDEVEDALDKMKNVKQHEEGDYVDTIELKEEDKIKGADGKECWDGYRYAGTDEDGKDKCVPSGKKKVNEKVDKENMPCNEPRTTDSHKGKSHVVKACEGGKEKIIPFGEKGASTAGKPKEGESKKMKAKRRSFKARHGKNIEKGKMSAAYWADEVKW